jgi:peptide/nickel transport system substrate-binding protein
MCIRLRGLRGARDPRCGVQRSERAGPQAAGQAGATQSQVRQTPREQLQDGGTFTWPIDSFPVNFNYHELDGTDVGTAQIDLAMLPAPFTIDAEGNPIWSRDLLAGEPFSRSNPDRW